MRFEEITEEKAKDLWQHLTSAAIRWAEKNISDGLSGPDHDLYAALSNAVDGEVKRAKTDKANSL